jgi:hypothetical protein
LWIQQAVRLGRVDLRKVAGEVNPADLFTKHSLSQLRLEELVVLHGCKYLEGRAESAPLTRTGVSSKTTMASAGREVSAVAGNGDNPCGSNDVDASGTLHGSGPPGAEPTSNLGSGSPIMPHLSLDSQSLDASYPSLVAPVDDWLEDVVDDSEDGILKAGERIASEIREAMQTRGRRRRVAGDMVGLVGESSAGSTTHTDRVGWSNRERQGLVTNVPTRDSGGLGGMGQEAKSVEQQEEKDDSKEGNPAAKSVRRRSVKMCTHLGRIHHISTTTPSSSPSISSSSSFTCMPTSCSTCRILCSKDRQDRPGEAVSEHSAYVSVYVRPPLRPFGPKSFCLSSVTEQ